MVRRGDTKVSISSPVSSRDVRDDTVDSDTIDGWLLHEEKACECDRLGDCSSPARVASSFEMGTIATVRGPKGLSLDMLDILMVTLES